MDGVGDVRIDRPGVTGPRLVAAHLPGPGAGLVRFHPRLTVLSGFAADIAGWVAGLHEAGSDTRAVVTVDGRMQPAASVPDAARPGRATVVGPARLRETLAGGVDPIEDALRLRAESLRDRIEVATTARREADRRLTRIQQRLDDLADPDARRLAVVAWAEAESAALRDELTAVEAALAGARPRPVVAAELEKWEQVAAEARHRLAARREEARGAAPADIAEATRLRSEWRYAEQVAGRDRRRRSRREADLARGRYEQHLARFGATTFEDLAIIGTGFGTSEADIAIREAATVVSMAEQHCLALRDELAGPDVEALERRRHVLLDRAGVLLGPTIDGGPAGAHDRLRASPTGIGAASTGMPPEPSPFSAEDDVASLQGARQLIVTERERAAREVERLEREHGAVERARFEIADERRSLASLGPLAVDALLRTVCADRSHPLLVIDDVVAELDPRSRRSAFDTLADLARDRQVVLVSRTDEVADWAAALPGADALVWSVVDAVTST